MMNWLSIFGNISTFWLIIGSLAAWRITSAIHSEGIARPIRSAFGGSEDKSGNISYRPIVILGKPILFFAELLSCFWCLSFWVGILTFIMILVFPYILIPFAISALAIMYDFIIERLRVI